MPSMVESVLSQSKKIKSKLVQRVSVSVIGSPRMTRTNFTAVREVCEPHHDRGSLRLSMAGWIYIDLNLDQIRRNLLRPYKKFFNHTDHGGHKVNFHKCSVRSVSSVVQSLSFTFKQFLLQSFDVKE